MDRRQISLLIRGELTFIPSEISFPHFIRLNLPYFKIETWR